MKDRSLANPKKAQEIRMRHWPQTSGVAMLMLRIAYDLIVDELHDPRSALIQAGIAPSHCRGHSLRHPRSQ